MKVLIFTTQFYLCSGAERLAIELAIDLNRRGIQADLLSLYDDALPGVAEKTLELQEAGVPKVRFLGLQVNPPISAVLGAIATLRRLVKTHKYDIVETAQLSPAVIASWATIGTRCRHLCGVHAVYQQGARESRQLRIWRLTARMVRTSRYYAISRKVADAWARYTMLDLRDIPIIYNSINSAAFEAQSERNSIEHEFALPAGARIVLFVGRLDQFKGVDTALEALGPVIFQENLVLLYVGHAEHTDPAAREMLDTVLARVRYEGWETRVQFLGRREDVFRLMASSDLLVHPARTEGFGLVLAEAMATGLPIVASNVDGIPEVVAGTDAQIIPPDEPLVLREAALRVLGCDAAERLSAIIRGRERAAAFRTDVRTTAMLELMSQIIT